VVTYQIRQEGRGPCSLLLYFYFPIALPEAKAGNRHQGREDNVPVLAVCTRPLTPFFIAGGSFVNLAILLVSTGGCGSVLSGVRPRANRWGPLQLLSSPLCHSQLRSKKMKTGLASTATRTRVRRRGKKMGLAMHSRWDFSTLDRKVETHPSRANR
jgi:hypothetical protein